MNILALDTAQSTCSVALWCEGDVTLAKLPSGAAQSAAILPIVRELFHHKRLSFQDLTGFAYAAGPGTFTGVRLGVGLVQGWMLATGLPALGVSSLGVLVWRARQCYPAFAQKTFVPLLDARMDEVYFGVFDAGDAKTFEDLCTPENLTIPKDSIGIGMAWAQFADRLPKAENILPEITANASDIAGFAAEVALANWEKRAGLSLPNYVRNQVAHVKKING